MRLIRRETFEYQGKRYEILVEHEGSQLKATAMRNGKLVKDSAVTSGLEATGGYDSTVGMESVDVLIGVAQERVRKRMRV